jgi:PPOX class probable F420-dependent enzyme
VNEQEARRRFAAAQVARLGTVGLDARPHIVPVVFAVEGDRIYSGIDEKPKRDGRLKRLRNISENPAVSMLVDHYEDDWEKLWWVRADGDGRIVEDDEEIRHARELLLAKYPQYRELELDIGGAIAVDVARWSFWSYR